MRRMPCKRILFFPVNVSGWNAQVRRRKEVFSICQRFHRKKSSIFNNECVVWGRGLIDAVFKEFYYFSILRVSEVLRSLKKSAG